MMLKPEALVEVGWENRSHLSYTHCINIRSFNCSSCFTKMPKIGNSNVLMSRYISYSFWLLKVMITGKGNCLSLIQAQQSTDA
uniref:Putative ovule protein n=1 Tax=Solanum chacoense TaxID=4108 RepID=A0A0V0GKJ3_SOLCH